MHSQFIKFHKELFQVIIEDAFSSRLWEAFLALFDGSVPMCL